jgi:hypothetical protein
MGGMGSFARWMRSRPKLGGGDLAHPTAAGAELLGEMLYRTLMREFQRGGAAAARLQPDAGTRGARYGR